MIPTPKEAPHGCHVLKASMISIKRAEKCTTAVALLTPIKRDYSVMELPHALGESIVSIKKEDKKTEAKSSKLSKAGSHHATSPEAVDKVTRRVVAPYAQITRKSAKVYDTKDEKYLDLERFKLFLDDEVDLDTLLYETAVAMKNLTSSSGLFVYIVNSEKNEIVLMPRDTKNPERHEVNIPICTGQTAAAHAAATCECVVLDDVQRDTRLAAGLHWAAAARTALCAPVAAPDGRCCAVLELYRTYSEPYDNVTVQWAQCVCGWAGAALQQTRLRVSLQRRMRLDSELQRLMQMYFSDRAPLDTMLTEMLALIKSCIGALRSTFYIVDPDHISDDIVADMWDDGFPAETAAMPRKKTKVNLSTEQSPAGLVARTGTPLNLSDAYCDHRFAKEVDPTSGAVVRTLLASALTDKAGAVIGLVQLINKTGAGHFTPEDEEVFGLFLSYCSLVVHFANMQHGMEYNEKLNEVYGDLMSLHLAPCRHDLDDLLESFEVAIPPPNFKSVDFHISEIAREEAPRLICYMIGEILGHNYDNREMADFVLTVLACYRRMPYHNADHAFNFAHTMYVILSSNSDFFSFNERMALLIGGLCHDLDHPGYNNNFLALIKHPLSAMYRSSTLEHHHYFMAKKLLEDKNILNRLHPLDRERVLAEMQYAILCTDLAVYFQLRAQLAPLVSDQTLDYGVNQHRSMIKGILMTTCDLSGCCKPFAIAKSITENVYEEFYNQGDREKEMGYTPLSMMDRRHSPDQPAEQVQFISVVVMPCLLLLQSVFPDTRVLVENCKKVLEGWHEEISLRGEQLWRQDESVPGASSRPVFQIESGH